MKGIDAPPFVIDNSFLDSQSPHLARSVRELRSRWDAIHGPILVDRDNYVGVSL